MRASGRCAAGQVRKAIVIYVAIAGAILLAGYLLSTVPWVSRTPARPALGPGRPATAPPPVGPPLAPTKETAWEDMAILEGRIVTAGGEPVPQHVHFNIETSRSTRSWSVSTGANGDRFSFHLQPGKVRLVAWADEYAPVLLGPWTLDERETVSDLVVTLDRGFEGRVRFLGTDGRRPASGVVSEWLTFGDSGSALRRRVVEIGAEGEIVLPHASSVPMKLDVRADGFEHESLQDVRLVPEQPYAVTLKPALPAAGRILDASTGDPIQGAAIRFLHAHQEPDGSGSSASFGDGDIWARSDVGGKAVVTSLRRDTRYWFSVHADGHAPAPLGPVRPEVDFGVIWLGPPVEVEGEVRAPDEMLQQMRGTWEQRVESGKDANGWIDVGEMHDLEAEEADGSGRKRFRITGLHRGPFELRVRFGQPGGKAQTFQADLGGCIRGLVITPEGSWIEAPASQPDTRPATAPS